MGTFIRAESQIRAQVSRALVDELTPEYVQKLVDELLSITRDGTPQYGQVWAIAVQALADKLTPAEARAMWPPVANWIAATEDPSELRDLAIALNALAPKLTADQAQAALAPVRSALAWAGSDDEAAAWASVFAELLLRVPGPNRVPEVVEVLKYPMAGGTGTDVLLDTLPRADPSSPGKSAGLDANLAWLRTTYPAIDLDARPACPPPPPNQQNVACPNGGD